MRRSEGQRQEGAGLERAVLADLLELVRHVTQGLENSHGSRQQMVERPEQRLLFVDLVRLPSMMDFDYFRP